MLAVYAGLLILIAGAIGGASLTWLTSRSDDRLAVISNFLSFGTLLLALVAGIVALAAYSAATGLPNLWVQVNMPDQPLPNNIRFVYQEGESQIHNALASIIVENTSTYAARTPAVIIGLRGAMIPPFVDPQTGVVQVSEGWVVTTFTDERNITEYQWDGGPNYSIHGNSLRHLPRLNLSGMYPDPDPAVQPEMVIKLLADGYSRTKITLPIEFSDDPVPDSTRRFLPAWL